MTGGDYPVSNGNIIQEDDVNNVITITVEAGEILSDEDICYVHLTDGKAYKSDTGTADDIRATGIALAGAASGADVKLQTHGVYQTTGLTDKQDYYLGAAGAWSTTQSGVRIGTALSTTELFINIVQDDRDAVGTIKAYHLSFTGIPANNLTAFWQLCDGTTISDAESPLNGQTIRDLNGSNEFLRGGDTSGGTGGTADGDHFHTLTTSATAPSHWSSSSANTHYGTNGTAKTDTTSGVDNQPPYMDVVWILKKK